MPKFKAVTFGITKDTADVWAFVSNLTLSFTVSSLLFKNHVNLALGKASTRHSNLACWSWIAIVLVGWAKNLGAP